MSWSVKVFFVGTGSGKTSLNRFHSSILLSTLNSNLLIDAGDGISRALLSHNIDYNTVDRIFITHLHADHYTGLPSLLTQMKMNGRSTDLFIYAEQRNLKVLSEFIISSYLFPERLGFNLNFVPVSEGEQIILDNNLNILARQNSHLDTAKNSNIHKKIFSSYSLMITAENYNIHYSSDVGSIKDLLLFDDYRKDLLICELTHIAGDDLQKYFASKINSDQVVFTHINEEDSASYRKIIAGLSKQINKKMMIADDGLEIVL